MPQFSDPFIGNVPRRMTEEELIRALRLALASEEEAVAIYTAQAEACANPLAKKVLLDIANEEREHAGEFQELLDRLAENEKELMNNGRREVEEMAKEL
jgi:rubrerythrin